MVEPVFGTLKPQPKVLRKVTTEQTGRERRKEYSKTRETIFRKENDYPKDSPQGRRSKEKERKYKKGECD